MSESNRICRDLCYSNVNRELVLFKYLNGIFNGIRTYALDRSLEIISKYE